MRKKAVYEGAKRGRKPVDHTGEQHHGLTIVAMIRRDPQGPRAKKKGNQKVQVRGECGHPECKRRFIVLLSHLKAGRVSCRKRRTKITTEQDWNRILVGFGLSVYRGAH